MTKTTTLAALAIMLCAGTAATAGPVSFAADCASDAPRGTTLSSGTAVCSPEAARNLVGNIEVFEDAAALMGDDDFFSLGLGGTLVIGFDPAFTGPAVAVEITNGRASSSHDEAAEVYGSVDGVTFDLLGTIDNQVGAATGGRGTRSTLAFTQAYSFLGFRDVSRERFAGTRSQDGFDLDAISVAAIPLPAPALMLLGSLGGLGAMRARRRA